MSDFSAFERLALPIVRALVALWVRPSVLPDDAKSHYGANRVPVYALEKRSVIDLAVLFDTVYTRLPQFAREAVDRSGWADIAMVQTRLQELLTESAGMIASQAVSIGSGALSFFLSFGVALYVMFFLLRDGERIGRTVLCAVPVERSIADRLAERFLGIVRATIKGTGVVALVQGALGTVTLMIAGVPSALLFGVIMAIFALVPVIGAGAVWVPAGLWLLITGETWQGLFVLLTGFSAGAGSASCGTACIGRRQVTVVPWPGVLSMRNWPPDWRTKPYTIDSPRPVPWPTGLVVKNGAKICCCACLHNLKLQCLGRTDALRLTRSSRQESWRYCFQRRSTPVFASSSCGLASV